MKQEKSIIFKSSVGRKILIHLNSRDSDYISSVTRKIGVTWSYMTIKFRDLEKEGLIKLMNKKGKNKYFKITDKGKKVVKLLLELNNLYKSKRR